MPETTWSDGDVANATKMNQIEDQLVVTCTSSTRPTGVEGRIIYETDTQRVNRYSSGGTWQRVFDERQSFSPSWSNLTVGNGTVNAYQQWTPSGLRVIVDLVWGSTTSISGSPVSITIPESVSIPADVRPLGSLVAKDGTTDESGHCLGVTTTISLYCGGNDLSSTNPFTWTTGDRLGFDIICPEH